MKHLTPLIAASVIGAFLFSVSALAEMKGGERLITLNAPKAHDENVGSNGPKMSCQVETRTSIERSARGAFKTVSVYTAHLCESCKTKEVSKGVGKLASPRLEHSCKEAVACCN